MGERDNGLGRRKFFRGSVVALSALILAACSKDDEQDLILETSASEQKQTIEALENEIKILKTKQTADAQIKSSTQTPNASSTTTPSVTETQSVPENTPTPNLNEIDKTNQSKLESASPGKELSLEKPGFTTIWTFPWIAEENEPKTATIALVWGKNYPSGIVTSADKIHDYYEREDAVEGLAAPPIVVTIARVDRTKRLDLLETTVSNIPPVGARIVDANSMYYTNDRGEITKEDIKQVKEVERLHEFISALDWRSLVSETGEVSGEVIGRFAVNFVKGLKDAGVKIPLFP